MLLQFTVENVLSFRDETVLSLLAAPGVVEHAPGQVIEIPGLPRPVLRVAAIYGANASGKSNLVKAMAMAALLVLVGTPPGDPIAVSPFKLEPEAQRRSSRFEFEIHLEGYRWSYGFTCTPDRIEAEWLFRDAGGGEKNIFERTAGDNEEVLVTIGDALDLDDERRQFLKFVAEGTRPVQLFLTEAIQRNVTELAALLHFFQQFLGAVPRTSIVLLAYNDLLATFAANLLRGSGTGVEGLEVVESKKDARDLDPRRAVGLASVRRPDDLGPRIRFLHSVRGTPGVYLEEEEESDGTRRLVDLSAQWFLLENSRTIVVIDELDRSLHTLLSRNLVERFLAADSSKSGQLIFTTHDTNLLDLTLLPHDSIWFVEKGQSGASTLYSLAEFKPEQLEQLGNKIESGYLQGRFGGTPFLSNSRVANAIKKGTS